MPFHTLRSGRRLMSLLAALAFSTGLLAGAVLPAQAADVDRQEIEKIVKDYLLENPEVIRDALAELDRREAAKAEEDLKNTLTENGDTLRNSPYQVVLGNPDGDVTLVEFFDYNCGYCKRAHSDMTRLLDEDKNLRIVLKEFPVLGQGSAEAAQVAIAFNKIAPEKYAEFHENLLMQRGQANHASALKAATDLGVSEASINDVIKTPLARTTIEEVYGLADKLGLTGTPSYVIGNEVVPGAIGYDGLKSRIEALRNCGQTTC